MQVFLTIADPNPTDKESYGYCKFPFHISQLNHKKKISHYREAYLHSTARDGIQLLLGALFSLPNLSSPEGPLSQLPPAIPTLNSPAPSPRPNPKPQLNGNASRALKVSSPLRRDKKFGTTSGSLGSRDGGGMERIGRR